MSTTRRHAGSVSMKPWAWGRISPTPQRPASSALSSASQAARPAAGWTAAKPTRRSGCLLIQSRYQPFCRSHVSWRSQYHPSITQAEIPASSMSAISWSGSAQPWMERLPSGATHETQPGSPCARPQAAGLDAASGAYMWMWASKVPEGGMAFTSSSPGLHGKPPAGDEVELPRAEERDLLHPDRDPRDPQVRETPGRELVPHLGHGELKRRQDDERLALR